MKYKLIFSDFDHTLLRDDFTVGERSISAIKEYVARGGNFVVCTGRMSSSLDESWRRRLGIADERIPVVGFQGSYIADRDGNVLHCDYVSSENVIRVLEKAEQLGVYAHTYDADYVLIEKENQINLDYNRFTGSPLKAVGRLVDYVKAHPDVKYIKLLMVIPPERTDEILAEYRAMGLKDVFYCMSSATYLECVSSHGGKGNGLKRVADLLGVPMSDTIAIGDNMNDIPMIERAAVGVAVENARPEVKAKADFVASRNDLDPIADVIEKYGFIE